MTEQDVRKAFLGYRWERAQYARDPQNSGAYSNSKKVETWLLLLTREERMIIRFHLIDGLDWRRTAVELDKIWGYENGRSERSLKRKQSKAIRKIVRFMEEDPYNGSINFPMHK